MEVILISPAMDGYRCMSQEERFEMGAESEEDFESRMAFRELMDR